MEPEKEGNAAEGEPPTQELEGDQTPPPETVGVEGQETPPPEPAPEVTPPAEPEAMTPERAHELAMDPMVREVLNEDMYRTIQALDGQRAAEANRERVTKLIEDEDFETLGKEYANIAARTQQAAEVQKIITGVRQEFYNSTFATLVRDMPELASLDAEGRVALDPSKFTSDAAYLKAIVDYVADKRIDTAAPARAKKILEDFGAAVEAQKVGSANEQAGKQPLLPGASPGASLPSGSSDLLNKAYAMKEGDEEE